MKGLLTLTLLLSGLTPALAVTPVPLPEVPGARQPHVAIAPHGDIHIVLGARDGVYCVTSHDRGATFQKPVKVGEPDVFALGMRRGPRIVATEKALVVTVIGGKQGRGRDEDLLAYRSLDGGRTWLGPVSVNTVRAAAREGLHHTIAGPEGSIFTVWNDLRTGRMEIWGALSLDGGATWQAEHSLYRSPEKGICPCCQPQAAYDPRGGLAVMWRNDLNKARDMYLIRSRDGGRTFGSAEKLGQGTWIHDRCPMDGGGLAFDTQGGIETIWRRDRIIYHARPGQEERALGSGEQGWAATGPDGAYLVWIDTRPGVLRLLRPGKEQPEVLAQGAWDPVVAAGWKAGLVVTTWEEGPNKGPMRLYCQVIGGGR